MDVLAMDVPPLQLLLEVHLNSAGLVSEIHFHATGPHISIFFSFLFFLFLLSCTQFSQFLHSAFRFHMAGGLCLTKFECFCFQSQLFKTFSANWLGLRRMCVCWHCSVRAARPPFPISKRSSKTTASEKKKHMLLVASANREDMGVLE